MKIGLVPMSAKPYHLGHHFLVTTAARENDKVLLFVSVSDRCRKGEVPIYGGDMKKIWCDHLESIIPENVDVFYGGSPIRKVFDTLIAEEEKLTSGTSVEHVYTIYSDDEDTKNNYTVGRSKKPDALPPAEVYFPQLYRQGYVNFAAEINPSLFTRGSGAPDVSGTSMRNMLVDPANRSRFMSSLPSELSSSDRESIYSILRKRLDELTRVDRSILEAFTRTQKKRPEKGTEEYSSYLEDIMGELQHIKSTYDSRKKSGARYRKEASKIQDAYSELRRLRNKNNKILDAQKINEVVNQKKYNANVRLRESFDLKRDDIKEFFKKFK